MEEGEGSRPGDPPGDRTATPGAISKDVLKKALKEVFTENPALLAAAGHQPDDAYDAGSGKQVG